ncbi:hypothetical protein [Treponema endosymbiont of Eucomonympha sp.]|uniref:hypothetical protein n=1 Tax=Treponema endosymbiont of Eucomonympha sp. TaxID=1580831 RepID=UPI000B2339D9|nr:hypothetical protein [Treponema endosymbiont of Eucomonympha sp.]
MRLNGSAALAAAIAVSAALAACGRSGAQGAKGAGEAAEAVFAVNTQVVRAENFDAYLEFGGDVEAASTVDTRIRGEARGGVRKAGREGQAGRTSTRRSRV